MLTRVGHYEITGTLGEGGMGIVYAARDGRLNRSVALKMIRATSSDPSAADRLRREAQAAATVNHPNICQLYDIGEQDGALYLAMEHLEGESLSVRLSRGSVPLQDAVTITLGVLSALDALHRRGLMHRDLKPSNIFLTPHGVKLLDFGLARAIETEPTETRLTMPGMMFGTPQYLPPEVALGQPVDARGDLFAAGVVLYEMLTGRQPFAGSSVPEIVHRIAYEHPPALGGSAAVAAVDRVIHKALAKRPHDRHESASAMADELRAAMVLTDSRVMPSPVRPLTRLVVLPFRLLRADPAIDFLAFSLPDALTTSLSGLDSLVVRSSLAASRFAAESLDLETIKSKLDVDAVLTGTLLHAEGQLRVTAQLAEVPSGTVRWSQTMQVRLGDIFQLQDSLTSRIVESLAVPLSARDERTLKRDVPASAKAFEYYLRANQIAHEAKNWAVARDLYRQCLEEDPRYAPAWARLARVYRLLSLYASSTSEDLYPLAEDAFRRALELNPDLSIAHNLLTVVEIETGRAPEAMLRLLDRARVHSNDPELFAGLVQACRYAGLLRPAVAASEHARRLEPQIRTAVAHAYMMTGDYERAVETDADEPPLVSIYALDLMGRRDQAIARLRDRDTAGIPTLYRLFLEGTCALLEDRRQAASAIADQVLKSWEPRDPCGRYYFARTLAGLEHPQAIPMFEASVEGGFHCAAFFARDPWLDAVRTDPAFKQILDLAATRSRKAAEAFVAAGGERMLGPVQRD